MNQFPCLIRTSTAGGEVRFALGDPLVDSYLAFVAGHVTQRRWPAGEQAGADIRFRVAARLADSEIGALDHFLYARWGMVAERRQQLWHGRVDHPRWPLHRADGVEIDQTLIEAAGLPLPAGAPHAHYSPGCRRQDCMVREDRDARRKWTAHRR